MLKFKVPGLLLVLIAVGLLIIPGPAQTPAEVSWGKYSGDVFLLAQTIYAEARGEPYPGQVAVGAVILNRTRNQAFPSTIPGVVFQPGAFTAVDDGQIYLSPDDSSFKAANDALRGWDPSGGAIYYFNPATATSRWIWSRVPVTSIGRHIFTR